MEGELLELLSNLELRFQEGHLRVAARFRDNDEVLDMIACACMGLWKYVEWSESRWVSMSNSCRAMLASMLTGIDSLIEHIRAKPHESDYFISGLSRCVGEVRRFLLSGRSLHG